MKLIPAGLLAWFCAFSLQAQMPVLKRSDVVFMYQAKPEVNEAYGATVLAWGGGAKNGSHALKTFGSVGMVTEFNRFHDRFPTNFESALCRGLDGQPYRVPWLTDHQHQGIPYWWCCTRQPVFQQYLRERVIEVVKSGTDGVHIDDHLGTAGSLFLNGCFCDRCVAEFPAYLATLPAAELAKAGITNPATFNYKQILNTWLAEDKSRKPSGHPLWERWEAYQLRGAAAFMGELRALAERTAGHPLPFGANAGLLWPNHLSDYRHVDLFSAEIEHHAAALKFTASPLVAYRIADAAGRPLAATASGQDWAFVKVKNCPGLVQGWIAFGYAAGNCLMAPHHQWCYTAEKGTHWYEGPQEKYAPLYQFVRQNAALFDDYRTHADAIVAFSYRTFCRDTQRIIKACNQLANANVSYQIALGGDAVVDIDLPANLASAPVPVLVIRPEDFLAEDQSALAAIPASRRATDAAQAIALAKPAAQVVANPNVRVLPRVKPGAAIIHLLNWNYQAATDNTPPQRDLSLQLDLAALGVAGAKQATYYRPGSAPVTIPLTGGTAKIPELGLWGLVEVKTGTR